MGVDEAKKIVDDTLNTELSSKGFLVASYDKILTWARTGSLWPMTFGLACCGVEMIHSYMARYDLDRYGLIPVSYTHLTLPTICSE